MTNSSEKNSYDIAIIGAGPCGIFAGIELMKKKKIAIFDVGRPIKHKRCSIETIGKCVNCKPVCNILGGFGGAQFFEGTKLSLFPAGTGLLNFTNEKQLKELYNYVEKILEKHGKSKRTFPKNQEIESLQNKFNSIGVEMKYYNAQKVSKNTMNQIGNSIYGTLLKNGAHIFLNSMVYDIERENNYFKLKLKDKKIRAKKIILAVGRIGSRWLIKIADKLGIKYYDDHKIELGIRIEMPYKVFNSINNIHNDLKLKRKLENGDELRTFCQDYKGFITKCVYNLPGDEVISSLDGHIIGTDEEGGKLSQVTNIAIHHRFKWNEGIEGIYSIIKSMNHGGKPIVQNMKSFLLDKKTNNKICVQLSMPDIIFDNINKYFPKKTLTLIKDFIHKLDEVLPGFAHNDNAVYAPSFEMGWKKMCLNKNFETNIKGIFIGGDVNGNFRGALQAMISGVIIGRVLGNE